MDPAVLWVFAIALGLGLLVGVQRERAQSAIAGVRTFALVTWFGAVSAVLATRTGMWLVGAGLLACTALAAAGYAAKIARGREDVGITTEIAVVLMYAIGALVVLGDPLVAVVLTGGVSLLLHWKDPLHSFARRIGEDDFSAVMRFVLIALVVLPVLPDRPMGPYGVLNPFHIWLMVVLIVGIGLVGYVAHKLGGERFGPLLGGVIGGLVSSTATTVSFARRAKEEPGQGALCVQVICIAAVVVFVRIFVEVGAAAPGLLIALGAPLGVVLCAALAAAALVVRRSAVAQDVRRELGNPAEIAPALVFAGLYAVVLLVFAFVREHLGEQGVFAMAFVAGLTDVDAITLSTARLSVQGRIEADVAWRAILIASLANLLFKAGLVAVLAPTPVTRAVAGVFAVPLATGAVLLRWWPL